MTHWAIDASRRSQRHDAPRIRFRGFELWQFAPDGLIGESQGNFDSADYQRQLEHGSSFAAPS